jgi:hypothetical protein
MRQVVVLFCLLCLLGYVSHSFTIPNIQIYLDLVNQVRHGSFGLVGRYTRIYICKGGNINVQDVACFMCGVFIREW